MRPLSFEKRALLRGALRQYANAAAKSPEDILAMTHALDEASQGALRGGLVGALGGYAIAPEGEEEDMALRGLALGAGANALRRGIAGSGKARQTLQALEAAPHSPEALEMRRRLRALQQGGAAISDALDY